MKKFYFLLIILLVWAEAGFSTDKSSFKLIVFSGSDWCINCIMLEKNVLSQEEFLAFGEENDLAVEKVDFPQKKKLDKETKAYNEQIAEQYQFDGTFPSVILSNEETGKTSTIKVKSKPKMEEFISNLSDEMNKLR